MGQANRYLAQWSPGNDHRYLGGLAHWANGFLFNRRETVTQTEILKIINRRIRELKLSLDKMDSPYSSRARINELIHIRTLIRMPKKQDAKG